MATEKHIPDYLAKKNAHPRDPNITFEEGPHIYTINGERGTYTSVTTFNHSLFSDFDAEKILDQMFKGKKMKDPTYKYYGMTREEILALWDKKKVEASGAGTQMHYDIECYYNGEEVHNESVEFKYFMDFAKEYSYLKAYRTEWMVYYEEVKICGSIDMVFYNERDNTYEIYDWKRCQEIKYDNEFGKNALVPCIYHLPDTNFWHYSLQLNTYKKILQDKYDLKISDMYLICIHPDNPYKKYDRIKVADLSKEVDELFEYRKSCLEQNIQIVKH